MGNFQDYECDFIDLHTKRPEVTNWELIEWHGLHPYHNSGLIADKYVLITVSDQRKSKLFLQSEDELRRRSERFCIRMCSNIPREILAGLETKTGLISEAVLSSVLKDIDPELNRKWMDAAEQDISKIMTVHLSRARKGHPFEILLTDLIGKSVYVNAFSAHKEIRDVLHEIKTKPCLDTVLKYLVCVPD